MGNNRPVTIYISAAPDLMAEREALARLIAELPVTLAWHIVQSPADGELIDMAALQSADLHLLVMGADIRAPIGLELHAATQAGRSIIAFRKRNVAYTPAGQIFIRQAQQAWRDFVDAAQLSQQVRQLLTEHLLNQAIQYALTPAEVIQLEQLLTAAPSDQQATQAEGTGHTAVLLSPERYIPSEGVIIDDEA